jgi:hypothetical protein
MPPGATPRPACPAPPSTGKPGGGKQAPPPAVPHVDLRTALSTQLPAVARRIARGLAAHRRSFVVPFNAAVPGTVTLAITRGRTRVALGRVTTTRGGALRIRVKLTHKGRVLLRRHARLRLRLAIAFAPGGGATVRVTRTFSVRPR